MRIDKLLAKTTAGSVWLNAAQTNGEVSNGAEKQKVMPTYRVQNKIDCSALGIESRRGKNKTGITAIDVAGALGLADISARQSKLLEAIYCDDKKAISWLLKILTWEIEIYLAQHTQRIAPKSHIEGCALAVLWQFIWLKPCKHCDASGVIDGEDCPKCEGSGSGKYSKRNQATIAGIPIATWWRHWGKVFEHFTCLLAEDLAIAVHELMDRIH